MLEIQAVTSLVSQIQRFQSNDLLLLNRWQNSQLIVSLPKFKHFLSFQAPVGTFGG